MAFRVKYLAYLAVINQINVLSESSIASHFHIKSYNIQTIQTGDTGGRTDGRTDGHDVPYM